MNTVKTVKDYYREQRAQLDYPASAALHYAREYVWVDEQEAREDIRIDIIADVDDTPVRGNAMASGDDDYDEQVENGILERLNSGDVWAWASVEVRVSLLCGCCDQPRYSESDYLGGCSYSDMNDFKRSGYYGDMIRTCLAALDANPRTV